MRHRLVAAALLSLALAVACSPSTQPAQPPAAAPSGGQAASPAAAPQAPAAPASSPAYAGDYTGMAVDAVDPSTIRITLDQPISTALFYPKVANYSGGFILCKRPAEKLGPDGLKTRTVGTGPFKFQRYSPKERVELV